MEIEEEVFQAIVLMDTFNKNFRPLSSPMAFLSVAGVPLIEYALQSLSDGRISKAILFCCKDPHKIEDYVKESKSLWKCTMDVEVKSSDTCQSIGDVMREIHAASLVKGDFILLGINTITNIDFASLLEQHKQTVKKDSGAVMTLVFNELEQDHALVKSDKSLFLAGNKQTKKVLVHQKWKKNSKEMITALPIKHLLRYSELNLYHSLVDPNIAVCSPSVPPLFADNLDFQTLESFIHGLLIQEDISANSLYYTLLKPNQYAAAVTNWKNYQVVSLDILHNSKYPRTIESGAYKEIVYLGKQGRKANISRSCRLGEDVLIGANSMLGDNTIVSKASIGDNVIIGDNVTIENSIIMDKAVIKDNVMIMDSLIGQECSIEEYCIIEGGTMIAQKLKVQQGTTLTGSILEKLDSKEEECKQSISESGTESENESVANGEDEFIGLDEMFNTSPVAWTDRESRKSPPSVLSGTESENESVASGEDEFIGLDEMFNTSPVAWTDRECCKSPPSVLSGTESENESVASGEDEFIGLDEMFNTSPVAWIDRECCKSPPSVLSGTESENESVASGEDEFIGLDEMFNTSPVAWTDRESRMSPPSVLSGTEYESESVASGEDEFIGLDETFSTLHLVCTDRASCKSPPSVLTVFLNELIDLLARGFARKIRCDHLILEINFSRYAYSIKSHEVSFFVVRALMNLPLFAQPEGNIHVKMRDVIKFFLPVFATYINNKSSIMDCLKAVEETCIQCEWMQETCGHILLMMYDIDIVDQDSLWEFHEYLTAHDSLMLQFYNVERFFDWLQESDEESE